MYMIFPEVASSLITMHVILTGGCLIGAGKMSREYTDPSGLTVRILEVKSATYSVPPKGNATETGC